MKKLMVGLMLTGAALMAQSGSAPATSPNSNATASDKTAPKVTKKHHRKAKKNAAPAANAVSNTNTAPAPAKK
jgi:hypothetical protein